MRTCLKRGLCIALLIIAAGLTARSVDAHDRYGGYYSHRHHNHGNYGYGYGGYRSHGYPGYGYGNRVSVGYSYAPRASYGGYGGGYYGGYGSAYRGYGYCRGRAFALNSAAARRTYYRAAVSWSCQGGSFKDSTGPLRGLV